jgi:hypothetical protein
MRQPSPQDFFEMNSCASKHFECIKEHVSHNFGWYAYNSTV